MAPADLPEASPPDTAATPVGLVSVVIPAWNEAPTMPELIEGVRGALEGRAKEIEFLVIVPGPSDPTGPAAEAVGARVLHQRRPGYGGALREGLAAARGDYVITMDGDLSHPPAAVPDLFDRRDDAEIVIGSRYVDGGGAEMSTWRLTLSRVLNAVYRRVLAVPVKDMSSGFRIYQRKVLGELDLVSEKYDVLEEILVKVYSLGWQVLEIPFQYRDRVAGQSHANVVTFTPHFLATLLSLWRMRNSFRSADYDSRAYDSLVLPQRMWQRARYQAVNEYAGTAQPRLDVGCGSSRIIQDSPDSVGLDLEPAKLRFLRRTNTRLLQGTAFHLPFADESFATLVSSQVIEHVPYHPRLFHEMNRVLRTGGTLVIGTPDYGRATWRAIEWLYKVLLPNAYGDDHITQYTRHRLTEELANSGFAIEDYCYVYGGELVIRCLKRQHLPAAPASD